MSHHQGIPGHAHSQAFLDRVSRAKSGIKETSIDEVSRAVVEKLPEFKAYSSRESDAVPSLPFRLVDVREDSEFNSTSGYILGAVHISKGVIERDIEIKIPNKSDEIVLYCGGGFRSA